MTKNIHGIEIEYNIDIETGKLFVDGYHIEDPSELLDFVRSIGEYLPCDKTFYKFFEKYIYPNFAWSV
jgi:hypothetical protein